LIAVAVGEGTALAERADVLLWDSAFGADEADGAIVVVAPPVDPIGTG
jgi:hypothetical protein